MAFTPQDEQFMQRALALARRGLGKTSPNPAVGALLVHNGRVISEGWHKSAGGPHAEVLALRNVKARGATLYVTMEPCSTWGKTPPCTDAIIAAGVKRVVVAALDPNPRHNERGLKLLRRAGIRVEVGLLADEATTLNEAFNKWVTSGIPLVIAKAAMSFDGKIATRTGDSKWITSTAARHEAHKLRAKADAIMVGANTVIRDDPRLTVRRVVRGKQPWRVVVDGRGRCPLAAKLFTNGHRQRSIVLTTSSSSPRWRRDLGRSGVRVLVIKGNKGRSHLRAALRVLGKMGITSVLVEGGGELLGSLFDKRLVDKVALFFAPVVIGGQDAVTAVGGEGSPKVKSSVRLLDCHWRRIGKDEMLVEARVKR
ncbi:MAG TPA: bifunctional diaminohydroxyphosphoribosylaminopyrimidine deaminase/5-amino-6-(5-phosphoribosylamino)uracil reductase RibD [Verrucomicrobiae bacterium]|nr:bifunctional diaminohydroxyphosphoribosylaminopyrimidine deaminase/5-amino-6-(5-phosphoribosylamino)uracil reductase RibD [Verrucomicrobiae bacterium]